MEDVEMNEDPDAPAKPQTPKEISKDQKSIDTQTVSSSTNTSIATEQAKDESNDGEQTESDQALDVTHTEDRQEEATVKIVVEESSEEKPLTSPPRKSARLSAKRPDSAASVATDSDVSVTPKPESPVPRRRSLRRSSTSSQDATPVKAKEDSVIKKLPTIVETTDDNAASSNAAQNETQKSEKALVDELAAAFVEDFIDDDE